MTGKKRAPTGPVARANAAVPAGYASVAEASRVEIIVERYRAGESPAELATKYRVPVELIDDAVRSELREAS